MSFCTYFSSNRMARSNFREQMGLRGGKGFPPHELFPYSLISKQIIKFPTRSEKNIRQFLEKMKCMQKIYL